MMAERSVKNAAQSFQTVQQLVLIVDALLKIHITMSKLTKKIGKQNRLLFIIISMKKSLILHSNLTHGFSKTRGQCITILLVQLDRKHPFIGWLLGPWHLTCRDSNKQEEYDAINNIFYFFNLHFKIVVYTLVWQFFKIWWLILGVLLYIGLNGLIINLVIQSNMEQNTKITIASIIGFIASVVWIAVAVFNLIVALCSLCKALHRYWPQIWRVCNPIRQKSLETKYFLK